MAKKLISVWLSLTILIFSSISIYADEVIQGDFFLKNIVINGENIVNYKLGNPFLIHDGRVYVPMDTETGSILGFEAEMDTESRTLKILKTEPTRTNVQSNPILNNMESVSVSPRYDIAVVAYTEAQNEDAYLAEKQADATKSDQNASERTALQKVWDNLSALKNEDAGSTQNDPPQNQGTGEISVPDLKVVQIELKGQPVLVKNEIVYVPLNAIVSSETLGWTSYYDNYAGVYISTDDGVDAGVYYNAQDAKYYRSLAAYIVNKNPKLTMSQAYEMVKYFEAYGQIYGVDLKLLMAMAECESCYTSDIYNSSNCCGLMQIKVSTGAYYGYTKAQLLQVKPNIQMGAFYISKNLEIFEGDKVKALAAYNAGVYAVQKGNYKTNYANKVISRIYEIESFVDSYAG